MNYFKFNIPQGLQYSPDWCGTMDKCPKDVKVLLYNDKEGYGIAQTEDEVPKEIEALDEKTALELANVEPSEGVYTTANMADRWEPELAVEEAPTEAAAVVDSDKPVLLNSKAVFCPTCHVLTAGVSFFDNSSLTIVQNGQVVMRNIVCKSINLKCPSGHMVEVNNG